ncbi:E3 ubiquitin-protein ligase RLIM isoform X2 [Macadamia integrifolia]|uniref:E3 ubiquitin-protein ligase RLIM isoform X2 n=1 Tax=Macadamia integrifolia TaxID=60698 RepID=UPI001C4F143B|nr:E3 ubiquitin-protein ligase RLIM isoform X2 [Macadamia integrifolia]
MGSSSSKDTSSSSSSSSAVPPVASALRRTRSKGARVFQTSCLGRSFGPYDSDNDEQSSYHRKKENEGLIDEACTDQTAMESNPVNREFCRKFKAQQQQPSNGVPCISSDSELDEWGQEIVTDTVSRTGSSSSRVASSRSLNSSSRFRSRFNFFPGNVSFRLSRAASLGSSRSYPLFSTSLTTSNTEEGFHIDSGPTDSSVHRNATRQGSDLLPAGSINRSPAPHYGENSGVLRLDSSASGRSVHLQNDEIVSTQDVIINNENTRIQAEVNLVSPRNRTDFENVETRPPERRIGAREPVERSVRFSRTLSVGRLRDRVLRRSSLSDGLFGHLQEERVGTDSSQGSGRQVWDGATRTISSDRNVETAPTSSSNLLSSMSSSRLSSQDREVDTSRPREARYHDILDHRTDFLERRRRIRSQVRALQRLGSRFENLSGHERSCILSGQHRTGHCSCRMSNRPANPDDDSSARASISRIVMLAEALFEQSVVLSSQSSVSSIGSVPAPKEVVESIPIKIYMKSQKQLNEEAAQCYICLVEYEEGDCMRILPCHHEFHSTCIDKWLKEIHRVCPLCRGDVCRTDSQPLPVDN